MDKRRPRHFRNVEGPFYQIQTRRSQHEDRNTTITSRNHHNAEPNINTQQLNIHYLNPLSTTDTFHYS